MSNTLHVWVLREEQSLVRQAEAAICRYLGSLIVFMTVGGSSVFGKTSDLQVISATSSDVSATAPGRSGTLCLGHPQLVRGATRASKEECMNPHQCCATKPLRVLIQTLLHSLCRRIATPVLPSEHLRPLATHCKSPVCQGALFTTVPSYGFHARSRTSACIRLHVCESPFPLSFLQFQIQLRHAHRCRVPAPSGV